jgi:hypothetical protein
MTTEPPDQPATPIEAIRRGLPNVFATTNPELGDKMRADIATTVLDSLQANGYLTVPDA